MKQIYLDLFLMDNKIDGVVFLRSISLLLKYEILEKLVTFISIFLISHWSLLRFSKGSAQLVDVFRVQGSNWQNAKHFNRHLKQLFWCLNATFLRPIFGI